MTRSQSTPASSQIIWLESRVVELEKQRDDLLVALERLSGMKLNMIADGIVDKAIARVKGGAA